MLELATIRKKLTQENERIKENKDLRRGHVKILKRLSLSLSLSAEFSVTCLPQSA